MDKKNNLKNKPLEKVVFLGKEEDIRKQAAPTVLLVILVMTLIIVFWKIAVRDPDAFEKSLQNRVERIRQEQERISEEHRKKQNSRDAQDLQDGKK
ncbi:MAG: hypothetical protein IPH06_10450 [Alphaproteobacteria bacterium]|jgi:hypothetical protein|nr:hypothetical protein [Alphaproteobacteria bacterium]QQS58404.1 MAG: hypothetical protein IPN28_06205 [Alphaproteobacteria bacterium]